ncbi:MAG: exodeoxyribonuclease VII large subunit [Acholeplasmataceae bacterium]
MNQQYLSVTALNKYIKLKLENDQHLKKVLLKGEISNFKRHQSGHLYFAIKDENSQISAMMFRTYNQTLNFIPKEGDKVLVDGYISLYEVRGTYSISVVKMTLDGIGELYLKYEKLKEEFTKLGYFDEDIKKPIPKFPNAIGVITSKTGAVIEDIKTTVKRRYLLTKIILYPSAVQGENAKFDLVKQLNQANLENKVDVLIIGRGGGSIEDLWGFNEPEVIHAIYNSKIPIITAIGHETDTTLSDFAGDLRAPTPTAAAELATPDSKLLLEDIKVKMNQIVYYIDERIKKVKDQVLNLDNRLYVSSPKNKLKNIKDTLDKLKDNVLKSFNNKIQDKNYQINLLKKSLTNPKDKLTNLKVKYENYNQKLIKTYQSSILNKIYEFKTLNEKLKVLNPLSIMERGFSVTLKNEVIIKSIDDVNINDIIDVKLKDGILNTKILSKKEE